jgi:hypothetical protein
VITTELSLAAGFAIRRLFPLAICLGVAFHTTLLVSTGSTYGLFYFAALSSYLVFVEWPASEIDVFYRPSSRLWTRLRPVLERLDLEQRFRWHPADALDDTIIAAAACASRAGVFMVLGHQVYAGRAAIARVILYNPISYLLFDVILVGFTLTYFRIVPWVALSIILGIALLVAPRDLCGRVLMRRFLVSV